MSRIRVVHTSARPKVDISVSGQWSPKFEVSVLCRSMQTKVWCQRTI